MTVNASYERPLIHANVLRLFRQRYNTWDIAKKYYTSESRVERALHEALEAERAAGKRKVEA